MTTAEPAVRKPTAKEIAEEALEVGNQLRTELTELRTQVRETGSVAITQTQADAVTPAQLDDLENRTAEGFERLQASMDALKSTAVRLTDQPPVDNGAVAALEKRVAESFRAQAQIIDSWGKSLTEHETSLGEIREAMPGIATLIGTVSELADKVRLFDEAGVAPASAEDLNDVHQRINEVREDLTRTREHVGTLTVPALRAAAIERVADHAVIDLHGNQAPAVYGQVWELMNLVTELGKDKTADKKMGGYAFRSVDSAMTAVGHALRQVGVMFQPREILEQRVERYETVSKDGYRQNWTHVWTRQRYAFVSLVDGSEMADIEMDGEARDNGDKSTSKADSMRLKYALLQALMIPITGLPESDGSDGTEGGQTFGRGDAGESWENATPARAQQPDLTEQHVDSRPPSTPEEVENSEDAGRGQTQRADTRTPEEKATAAYHALVALAGIEKPEQRPRLTKILNGIVTAGIGNVIIQTMDGWKGTLDQYAATVNAQVGS